MSTSLEEFQYLLQGMRSAFLDELAERCDNLDNLILSLEKTGGSKSVFDETYRQVHSLKGSGGMHGLGIITTTCHHLEGVLTAAAAAEIFDSNFVDCALAYVDILRKIEAPGRLENPDYTSIEAELESLRRSKLKSLKAGLIAESSGMMSKMYQKSLSSKQVQLVAVNNGMLALERLLREPFDFAIIGRELKELNGIAVIAALRVSQSVNQNIPVILVTSKSDNIPEFVRFNAVLYKDKNLPGKLLTALSSLVEC